MLFPTFWVATTTFNIHPTHITMPKRTREDEAGPSKPKLPPLMGMDDAAGSAGWATKKEKKEKRDVAVDEDEDDNNDIAGADEDDEPSPSAPKPKKKKKVVTGGVVYISRLPPGMTPHKVRHLMARWGEVGRVYAQRRDGEHKPYFLYSAILYSVLTPQPPPATTPTMTSRRRRKSTRAQTLMRLGSSSSTRVLRRRLRRC
jgi:ESF2/ABP1 family protein